MRRRCRVGLIVGLLAPAATHVSAQAQPDVPPLALVQPEHATAASATLTLADALDRARQNDAQFQSVVAEASSAHEDRTQARAALLPNLSFTTQWLGNQANGVNPNGRFVSLDGVNMYRVWGVLHQEVSPNVLMGTPVHRAEQLEAAAAARLEVARRGLAVTVTRAYYAVVTADRKYATAAESAQQAGRFLDVARAQQRLGQVAMSDVLKADIQSRQQAQTYREAALARAAARLGLAVLVSPTFDDNFAVVDDLSTTPVLPAFADVNALGARNNADLKAAQAALAASKEEVKSARSAFWPSLAIDAIYGIEANEFALHSRIAAQPELGVLPNLGYFITANLAVPVWDWGSLRSRLHQSEIRSRAAQVTLTQTQREALANLYTKYNEALSAKAAADAAGDIVDLATESLRLIGLRYGAGESTALEVVDAQNTLLQARNARDDASARYRVALADLQTLTGSF